MSGATTNSRQYTTEQHCYPEVSILNLHMLQYLRSTTRAVCKNETHPPEAHQNSALQK